MTLFDRQIMLIVLWALIAVALIVAHVVIELRAQRRQFTVHTLRAGESVPIRLGRVRLGQGAEIAGGMLDLSGRLRGWGPPLLECREASSRTLSFWHAVRASYLVGDVIRLKLSAMWELGHQQRAGYAQPELLLDVGEIVQFDPNLMQVTVHVYTRPMVYAAAALEQQARESASRAAAAGQGLGAVRLG